MATDFEVYPRAPITEAVLDIRITPADGLKADAFVPLTKQLADHFPHATPIRAVTLTGGVNVPPKTHETTVGYRGAGRGNDRVYQATLSGIAVSKLAPYSDWTDLKGSAEKVWRAYRSIVEPVALHRAGLRYINRIDIPYSGPEISLEEYLLIYVEVPPSSILQRMNHFIFQIHLQQDDLQGLCVINSTIAPPSRPSVLSVILDIDLFTNNVPESDAEMWGLFDRLRVRKNEIFESCITERTREFFRE